MLATGGCSICDLQMIGHRDHRAELGRAHAGPRPPRGDASTLAPILAIAASISPRMSCAESCADREVAGLGVDAVAEVAAFVLRVVVGRQSIESTLKPVLYGSALKRTSSNTKNSASGREDRVADAHGLDHRLGLLACRADRGCRARRWSARECRRRSRAWSRRRTDRSPRSRVRHQAHVGSVDRLPAGDRGAVEHRAFREHVFIDHALVEGHVLPLAARIGERRSTYFTSLSFIIFSTSLPSSWVAFPCG